MTVTLGQGSKTVQADVDKTLPVIVKDGDLGRPRVVAGASALGGPVGPFQAAGGGRQFQFDPKKTGTATIAAKASQGTDARLVVHVVCPGS